jgi:hypothetical protein
MCETIQLTGISMFVIIILLLLLLLLFLLLSPHIMGKHSHTDLFKQILVIPPSYNSFRSPCLNFKTLSEH